MKRQANKNYDSQSVISNSYNEQAGAKKVIKVGAKLVPISLSSSSWTTDASTAREVGFGAQLAIYNNSASLASVIFGDSTVVTKTAGQVETNGEVAVALKPNDWTYVCSGEKAWAITSASTCLTYIVLDDTELVK